MRTFTLFIVGLAFLESTFSRGADLTGKWRTEFDTQIGKQKYLYELKADGDKVTGKAIGDVNGGTLLAHRASKEARIAVEAMLGEPSAFENIVIDLTDASRGG